MRLSRTVFETLLLIFQKLKRSCDSDHAPFRDNLSSEGWDLLWSTCTPNLKSLAFQGHFVIRRLGGAMFNPHIKHEMSTITCNEEVKGNAKCNKNSSKDKIANVNVLRRHRKCRGQSLCPLNWVPNFYYNYASMVIYAPNHLCTYAHQTELSEFVNLNNRWLIAHMVLIWS